MSPPRRAISARAAPEQGARRLDRAGREEDAVAGRGADVRREPRPLGVGEVLGDRAAELTVLADEHVGQTPGAALLGPLLPGVELLARLAGTAGHDDGTDVRRLEDPELGVGEVVGALGQLEVEAQVGLVGAVPPHGLGVGQPRQRERELVADELPHAGRPRPRRAR